VTACPALPFRRDLPRVAFLQDRGEILFPFSPSLNFSVKNAQNNSKPPFLSPIPEDQFLQKSPKSPISTILT
jgi:hypothetical protein